MKALKLLPLLLAVLLALGGCSKERTLPLNAKEYGYFCFDNIDWGVSTEELFSLLDKSESDFEKFVTYERDDRQEFRLTTPLKFMGKQAMIDFMFVPAPMTTEGKLQQVHCTFDSDFTEKEFDKLCQSLKEEVDSQEIKITEPVTAGFKLVHDAQEDVSIWVPENDFRCDDVEPLADKKQYTFDSKAATDNLPEEIKKPYNAFAEYLVAEGELKLPIPAEKGADYTNLLKSQLSVLKASYEQQTGIDKGKVSIAFIGSGYAGVRYCVDAYHSFGGSGWWRSLSMASYIVVNNISLSIHQVGGN